MYFYALGILGMLRNVLGVCLFFGPDRDLERGMKKVGERMYIMRVCEFIKKGRFLGTTGTFFSKM